jgi:hypothetical protein
VDAILDQIDRRPAAASPFDRIPNRGRSVIIGAQKPTQRITPESSPRLKIVLRERMQANELVPLELGKAAQPVVKFLVCHCVSCDPMHLEGGRAHMLDGSTWTDVRRSRSNRATRRSPCL